VGVFGKISKNAKSLHLWQPEFLGILGHQQHVVASVVASCGDACGGIMWRCMWWHHVEMHEMEFGDVEVQQNSALWSESIDFEIRLV
jgi:hypothetical protein